MTLYCLMCLKKREWFGLVLPTLQKEYQLFKQHCTGNDARLERGQQHAIVGIAVHRTFHNIIFGIGDVEVARSRIHGHVVEQSRGFRGNPERF